MKKVFFTIFIAFILIAAANAQISETKSELTPVAPNTGKFSKRLPHRRNRIFNSDNLKFEVAAELVSLPNNEKGIAVTVQTTYKEIVFEQIGSNPTARINIYGRITSKDKVTDGFFEGNLREIADVNELVQGISKTIILRKVFQLPKGNYQVGVIITDINSGIRGVKVVKFQIF